MLDCLRGQVLVSQGSMGAVESLKKREVFILFQVELRTRWSDTVPLWVHPRLEERDTRVQSRREI